MHRHHHHHRRRKKRPNYGNRTVEVCRGLNGFGFTISGQQPCILSCIVANSPADLSGLRAGDFLISVNGLNVSKLPHESVVQLIGNSSGNIKMTIAENYYSDSSDDDNIVIQQNYHRVRHKNPHSKLTHNKNRMALNFNNLPSKLSTNPPTKSLEESLIEDKLNRPSTHNINSPSHSKDITNVRAVIRMEQQNILQSPSNSSSSTSTDNNNTQGLEYRAIVGYLGTIEMPKQIATSSKLQTVRSCIRKLRQEKRNPSTVLMTILPNFLLLKNNNNIVIAKYPSSRLNYVSSSSENNDNKFFGLVTSQIYADGQMYDEPHEVISSRTDINISNSCHVFVIDGKLVDHINHIDKADLFKITCTKDPISNLCLEFPSNAEYVVNLIRSMYTLKSTIRINENNLKLQGKSNLNFRNYNPRLNPRVIDDNFNDLIANSPQPSEITTTSSNSDSGIGFHNDLSNISDRIVVVDFPRNNKNENLLQAQQPNLLQQSRPHAIINEIPLNIENKTISPNKSISPIISRLTVRAMPDPKIVNLEEKSSQTTFDEDGNLVQERPVDVPKNYESIFFNNYNIHGARSCDDIMIGYDRKSSTKFDKKMSIDDMTMLGDENKKNDDHLFLLPTKPIKKLSKKINKKLTMDDNTMEIVQRNSKIENRDKLMSYKLSPKVFGVSRPYSMSVENLTTHKIKKKCNQMNSNHDIHCDGDDDNDDKNGSIWGSLQELRSAELYSKPMNNVLEGTYSEPDLREDESRNINLNASPFRRWGQSSLRARANGEIRSPISRRPSSAASENDVYTKSEENRIENNTELINGYSNENGMMQMNIIKTGPSTWSSSFERLLNDSSGIHTFSEFLKKEFSAENIYFWTACERYSKISDASERAKEAIEIFEKHLVIGAPEPVNVDAHARNVTQENLKNADKNLFSQAQKQIFNLMKFDSYARFIRSDLYKQCLEAEEKCQILPYAGGEQLDPLLRTGISSPTNTKLKKSLSNADDRRRKSLLPWHRKARCKSKDRDDELVKSTKSIGGTSIGSSNGLKVANSGSDVHSSRSSLSSFDAALSNRNNIDSEENRSSLCRVLLADGATTIVQTRPNETIRDLVERLLEKRGICYQAYEAFLTGCNKPIELDSISTCLAGKEVQIEQRVIFKLDLPNRKVISVKSKPCKLLGDVLRPILNKYNFKLDLVLVYFRESTDPLDMTLSVTIADGQRLQVICKTNEVQSEVAQISNNLNYSNQIQKVQKTVIGGNVINPQQHVDLLQQQQQQLNSNLKVPFNNKNLCNKTTQTTQQQQQQQQNRLDEITNKVFNELMQTKSESHLLPPPRASDQGSTKSDDWGSETSSGIFARLRSHRQDQLNVRINRNKKPTIGSEDGMNDCQNGQTKKPLIAKWKAGVKLQVTTRSENHDLLEGLKRAQRSRLEDQRGTEINFELPDFLKDKENNLNNNKFRKLKESSSTASLNGLQTQLTTNTNNEQPQPFARSLIGCDKNIETVKNLNGPRPQPAPRLSINSKNNNNNNNNNSFLNSSSDSCNNLDTTIVFNHQNQQKTDLSSIPAPSSSLSMYNSVHSTFNSENPMDSGDFFHSNYDNYENRMISSSGEEFSQRGPPPLPPKPKILPMKPSNWGQHNLNTNNQSSSNCSTMSSNSSGENQRRDGLQQLQQQQRNVYLDQPSSSFV